VSVCRAFGAVGVICVLDKPGSEGPGTGPAKPGPARPGQAVDN